MKIMSVVGARPQFVKLAPISRELSRRGIHHVIVHTGQHYDPLLSDSFFEELQIPRPNHHLAVGSQSHGHQTAQMLAQIEDLTNAEHPDWMLVYGDTNSTLAAALAAVKLLVPLAHLEAGLRSFNRSMPEEHNRVLTDHAADLLLAPTAVAARNLEREGLAGRTRVVGDVMTDVLFQVRDQVADLPLPLPAPPKEYYLATLHRPQNTDDPDRLAAALEGLAGLDRPVFLLAHPRLLTVANGYGLAASHGALQWHDPLPYPQLVKAAANALAVITDSGGLQKEAFLLRTPCVTVRSETEWVETVELGWNTLAEPGPQIGTALERSRAASPTDAAPYGDGHAARAVADALMGGGQ